jgi:hypothetical protein
MFGTYTQAQNNSTGIISNLYGLYIDNPINPSGTITNKYAIVTAANAGNVGIGTASPNEKLHVNGGMVVTGAASETIGVNGLFFGFNPGGNTASIDAVQQGTDFRNLNVSAKNFSVLSWNGSAQVLGLYQNNSGNVGVGTSPAYNYKLDVAGPVRSSSGGFVFPDGTSQTTAATPVSYGSTAGTAVQGNTSLSLTAGTGISGGGTVTLGSGGSVTLTNADRGSSQSIFKNVTNGSGAVQFSAGSNNDAISFEGAGGTSVTFNAAAKKVVINSAAAQSSGWTDSGSSVSLTNGSASVGVGTAAPVRGLHVSGANGTAGAEVAIANTGMPAAYRNFNFWGDSAAGTSGRWYVRALNDTGTASGRDFLTFDNASGNVGAGTASPAAKLDVRVASLGAGSNTMLWSPSGTADANTSYVHFGTAGDWYIRPGTTAGRVVIADNGGNVGIGTAGPGYKLDVAGSVNGSGLCIAGDCKTGWAQVGASQWTTSNSNIYYSTGSVGIGTQAPAAGAKLDVAGNLNVSAGNVTVSGDITATGTINAKFQDMAEWVPAAKFLPAGTVVVLDATHNNQVTTSSRAYDTRVAGVVSPQPGITLGERGEGKALVATTGRVRVKVDATRAPISVGDLLVTSDIEGVAMKSIPVDLGGVQIHRPGTIIGKALEPLEKGKGEILVLLSLQ